LTSQNSSLKPPSDWDSELRKFREGKDAFYQTGEDSPIPHAERHNFHGLKYFPPDPSFRHKTALQRYDRPELVTMTTSKGTRSRYHRIGYFQLEISGKKIRLQAYKSAEREGNDVFIPFKDTTSGKESYGSARYLDLEEKPDEYYVIDFNYAYNPYCAYSEDYVCPFPPRDNWLDVAIRAGERKYHD